MEILANIFVNGLLLFVLWWLFFVEYKRYRCDRTRQELFKIRDQLFQKAADGVLPFDSKAYCLTRTTLNGMIRFAHEVSFIRLLLGFWLHKSIQDRDAKRYLEDMSQALNDLPEPGRTAVKEARSKMHLIIISHVIHTSLALLILLKPFLYYLRLVHKLSFYQNKAETRLAPLDAEARHVGNSICPAH